MRPIGTAALLIAALASPMAGAQATAPAGAVQSGLDAASAALTRDLLAQHGEGQRARIERGVRQARAFWRAEDGDDKAFAAFARAQFAGDPKALDALFGRLEFVLESYFGHALEVGRDFKWHTELDLGPVLPVDEILSGFDPGAHFIDDAFANKLAFVVLLNFPLSNLEERLKGGDTWTRRQWAEARLTDLFARRVPAEVNQAAAEASGQAERYIASYNIWMHHLVDAKGQRLFEPKKRLLTHWNLRDELKSRYAQGPAGLAHQRSIQKVMERIVTQTIPADVIDNPTVDWNPYTNEVRPAAVSDSDRKAPAGFKPTAAPEPDTRYKVLLDCFLAMKKADPYSPTAPTHIARSYEEGRQLPEARVKQMLETVCSSPLLKQVAQVMEHRLGRKLEPFDIWYNGFRPGANLDEAKLDAILKAKYPTAAAYKADMPNLLKGLGFSPERAAWLASRIEVDPARGSGHAMGAQRRADNAHLRTRVGADGMDYKGFNIAVHEMGHNVEQTFSLVNVDHWLLNGVPNTAFTEALAFVFQAQDLKLLGQPAPDAKALAEKTLNDFWATYEIAGVGLVDTAVWHWMYEHPSATPGQLKEAVLAISKEVWNRYYAPVLGQKDCVLLGIYSHMISSFLYLPDYPIGHMIAFQIEHEIEKTGKLGETFERMATQGRLTPDLWMRKATGRPVGPEALLEATEKALKVIGK
ncbi:hypothetical protein [Geothrix sp. PMB-07]|uniref:hypothetical protein n=1 Tax=Geothrix sp. PMB-07 TaxID=3068640 RepID=UPI0027410023|nr:hypothetical protein [Geothrix sp. PMB-07]WLT31079.1 hypothetical protein Q9293_15280 [Geothrix sp. PMB-07]